MSTAPFDPDDPRLTAYALGEADETDRRAVEEILKASSTARAEVDQTQTLARLLATEYARENERHFSSCGKIVPFPHAGSHRWRRRIVPVLQAAAALMLTASVAYLVAKPMHWAAKPTVVSATPAGPAVMSDPISRLKEENPVGEAQAVAAIPPPEANSVSSTPNLARTESDQLLAVEIRQTRMFAKQQAPAPATAQRAAVIKLPDSGVGANLPEDADAPAGQAARCTVRIRAADGSFFAGVIVSDNGLIVSFSSLQQDIMQLPFAVVLDDGRKFTATAVSAPLGPGWYWLRIKAVGLPFAPPATKLLENKTVLTAALVEPKTGNLIISSRPDGEIADLSTTFLFNAVGQLLVTGTSSHQQRLASPTDAATRRIAHFASSVRLFTPTERKMIEQESRSGKP